jgi:hypothetical protein
MPDRPTRTTAADIPTGDNQNSMTAGPRGPLLVQDTGFISLIHVNADGGDGVRNGKKRNTIGGQHGK